MEKQEMKGLIKAELSEWDITDREAETIGENISRRLMDTKVERQRVVEGSVYDESKAWAASLMDIPEPSEDAVSDAKVVFFRVFSPLYHDEEAIHQVVKYLFDSIPYHIRVMLMSEAGFGMGLMIAHPNFSNEAAHLMGAYPLKTMSFFTAVWGMWVEHGNADWDMANTLKAEIDTLREVFSPELDDATTLQSEFYWNKKCSSERLDRCRVLWSMLEYCLKNLDPACTEIRPTDNFIVELGRVVAEGGPLGHQGKIEDGVDMLHLTDIARIQGVYDRFFGHQDDEDYPRGDDDSEE